MSGLGLVDKSSSSTRCLSVCLSVCLSGTCGCSAAGRGSGTTTAIAADRGSELEVIKMIKRKGG